MEKNFVMQVIESRRSIRAYKEEQLSKIETEKILNAGLLAPTAANRQSCLIIAVQDQELLKQMNEALQKVLAGDPRFGHHANETNFSFYFGAPTVFMLFGDASLPGAWAQVDGGITVENMCLAAESLNIGT